MSSIAAILALAAAMPAATPQNLLPVSFMGDPGLREISVGGVPVGRDRAGRIWLKTRSAYGGDVIWVNATPSAKGDIRSLLVFGDHKRNAQVSYRYSLRKVQIDCRRLAVQLVWAEYYRADGKLSGSDLTQNWNRIAVASPAEDWGVLACS